MKMRLKWVKVIKNKDWVTSKCFDICSLHFEGKYIISNNNDIRNLTKNVVPI